MIYLDSAATTLQKPPQVAQAVARAVNMLASPGRGGHRPSVLAGEMAYRCREAAAQLFHLDDPQQVVFTLNATHALNIAIHSLVKPGDKVVVSAWEHNAVTRTLQSIADVEVVVAKAPLFNQNATLTAFSEEITSDVKAVIFTHISNVFGFILPVDQIAALCRSRNIPFIIDASQSAGCQPIDFRRLGADFIAMPGHKGLFGPQGTGLLLCGQNPEPLITGGTGSESRLQSMPEFLPDRVEAGTHNMAGIAGLLEGIRYVQQIGIEKIGHHERALMEYLTAEMVLLPSVEVFSSSGSSCQSGVLSLRVEGLDCETLGERLAEQGVCTRAGLHCAPLAHQTAGTLASGTLRISVSPFNSQREMERFIDIFSQCIG